MSVTGMPTELTAEEITRILAEKRNRGGHEAYVRKVEKGGDMYSIVNHDPSYKGKTPAQLKSSVKQGLTGAIKKIKAENADFPDFTVVENGDDLLIVNKTKVAANLAPAE